MQISFKGILTTLRSNRNLAAFLISIVLMEIVQDAVATVQGAGLAVGPIAGGFPRERVYHLGRSNPAPRRHRSITAHQGRFAF